MSLIEFSSDKKEIEIVFIESEEITAIIQNEQGSRIICGIGDNAIQYFIKESPKECVRRINRGRDDLTIITQYLTAEQIDECMAMIFSEIEDYITMDKHPGNHKAEILKQMTDLMYRYIGKLMKEDEEN